MFHLKIRDKAKMENIVVNHLCHKATLIEGLPINDSFPDDQFLAASHKDILWYADLVDRDACRVLPSSF